MLSRLVIQNYALIDSLDIHFTEGLNIITGETGAGKSILLGALGLILGHRADTQSLLNKEKKCFIEGEFNIEEYSLNDFFGEHNLDYEKTTIIRREINPDGKSRAFINDTPVALGILKELSSRLVDIHSQHENLSINNPAFQLSYIDAFASNQKLLKEYKKLFDGYQKSKEKLALKIAEGDQLTKDLDYFQFQFNELDDAKLVAGEQAELEQRLETLNNSETIKSGIGRVLFLVNDDENSMTNQMMETKRIVSSLSRYNPKFQELHDRLNSVAIEINDISNDLEELGLDTEFEPTMIDQINERLDLIYRLEQKHRLHDIAELLSLQESLKSKIDSINFISDEIAKLQMDLSKLEREIILKADEISKNRKKVIPQIEKKLKELFNEVALTNAVLKINHEVLPHALINSSGLDKVHFLFSANKGVEYMELSKVASGGELSRLTLCLKALIAELMELPTIIFDEIDAGVSGEVANKVGLLMQSIAKKHQVITITHLPQIASKGRSHFFVYKEVKNDRTFTNIKLLDNKDRVVEIAKMLSGENPTTNAIENAKELLSSSI
ncbi:MAG: DNA repair protein RecN [Bacteroidota bacterium]